MRLLPLLFPLAILLLVLPSIEAGRSKPRRTTSSSSSRRTTTSSSKPRRTISSSSSSLRPSRSRSSLRSTSSSSTFPSNTPSPSSSSSSSSSSLLATSLVPYVPSIHDSATSQRSDPNASDSDDAGMIAGFDMPVLQSLAQMIHTWSLLEPTSQSTLDASSPTVHPDPDSDASDPDSDDFATYNPASGVLLPENPSPESGTTSYHTAHDSPASPVNPLDDFDPLPGPPPPLPSNGSVPEPPELSIDNLTTITSLQPHSQYHLRCWIGNMGISPAFPQPGDCLRALALLMHGDKIRAPILFGQRVGFSVPHRWVWDTCVIVLQIVDPNATVVSTMQKIADVVRLILENCVDFDIDHRGGLMRIEKMYVSLSGRVPGPVGERGETYGSESFS